MLDIYQFCGPVPIFLFGAPQMVLVEKNPPANAGDIKDMGSIPESGRSPDGWHGNPLQYSCLEISMNRGAHQAIYSPLGITESDMTVAS